MNRLPIAISLGLIGVAGYIAGAVVLADFVLTLNWVIQAIYFTIVGLAWAMPVRWLMLWSVGQR